MPDDIVTEALRLATADGVSLEAEVRVPSEVTGAAVLAHPHPLHGGSMRSLVTSELFRLLPERRVATIRFNFRGVEGSGGSYGEGRAERQDVAAAIEALAARVDDDVALVLAGWSFGADVTLSVLHERVAGWFAIAPPLRILPAAELVAASDRRPKLLAVPERDEFRPPASAREATAAWEHTAIEVIAGGDHFLAGRTGVVGDLAVTFLGRLRG